MKPEYIAQARDAIAGRASGSDADYYWSGDRDHPGFKEAVNTEYILRSLDLNCGWETALNEIDQLRKEHIFAMKMADEKISEIEIIASRALRAISYLNNKIDGYDSTKEFAAAIIRGEGPK